MTVNVTPSKFDICLLSGVIFNFACVTANYWPPLTTTPTASNVFSDPVRVLGSYTYPSSPYYLHSPNYPYSSRMDSSSYPQRADPYYYHQNRYPSTGFGYSNSNQQPPVYGSYGSASSSFQPYSGGYSSAGYRPGDPSTPSPYYRPPPPLSYQAQQSNQLPYQYWRNPANYDAFDRRGGVYGVPSGSYQSSYMYGSSMMPSYSRPGETYAPRTAYAKLRSKEYKVEGEVRFVQQDNRYIGITGRITGLVPGAHGLHVHEGVDKEGNCDNIGGHFNPLNVDHGGKSEWTRHVGDLGNVFADQDGVAYFSITDTLISLTGLHSILNRTLVVSEFSDDLGKGVNQSKINGNAGKPISCGIISLIPY